MKNKKLLLLIGAGVLAVASLVYGIATSSKKARQPSSAGSPSSETAAPVKDLLLAERTAKRSGFATWGRNPFVLTETSASRSSGMVLNGIAWDAQNPSAVINDQIVEVGSKINGSKVVKIEPNRVILNDGENDFELRLGRKAS